MEDLEDEEKINPEDSNDMEQENNFNDPHQNAINEMMQDYPQRSQNVSSLVNDPQFIDLLKVFFLFFINFFAN